MVNFVDDPTSSTGMKRYHSMDANTLRRRRAPRTRGLRNKRETNCGATDHTGVVRGCVSMSSSDNNVRTPPSGTKNNEEDTFDLEQDSRKCQSVRSGTGRAGQGDLDSNCASSGAYCLLAVNTKKTEIRKGDHKEGTVTVRWLNGDEVFVENCALVGDIRRQVAKIGECVWHDVALFSRAYDELENDEDEAPPFAAIVIKAHQSYCAESWSHCVFSHAACYDYDGMLRVQRRCHAEHVDFKEVLHRAWMRALILYERDASFNKDATLVAVVTACIEACGVLSVDIPLEIFDEPAPTLVYELQYHGCTTTHWAACIGNIALLRVLTHHSCDINAQGTRNTAIQRHALWTPLHFAAAADGGERACEYLLRAHACANARGQDGATPIHCAVTHGHLPACELLLTYAADIDTIDSPNGSGILPLYTACAALHVPICQRLLAARANPNAADTLARSTPLHAMLQIHTAHCTKNDNNDCQEAPCADVVCSLLYAQADVTRTDGFGNTPLHLAALASTKMVCALLIHAQASIQSVGALGKHPLHFAVIHRNWAMRFRIVQCLLDNSADVEALDDRGLSAVDLVELSFDPVLIRTITARRKPWYAWLSALCCCARRV